MRKILLGVALATSCMFAFGVGSMQITPEFGGIIGSANVKKAGVSKSDMTYGAYGRIWLGLSSLVIAPQVKYENIKFDNRKVDNIQYGGLLGLELPILPITIYGGASYSTFSISDIKSTYAVNYGVKIDLPFLPFVTIGFDGSWQNPKITGGDANIYTLNGTIGLAF